MNIFHKKSGSLKVEEYNLSMRSNFVPDLYETLYTTHDGYISIKTFFIDFGVILIN